LGPSANSNISQYGKKSANHVFSQSAIKAENYPNFATKNQLRYGSNRQPRRPQSQPDPACREIACNVEQQQ